MIKIVAVVIGTTGIETVDVDPDPGVLIGGEETATEEVVIEVVGTVIMTDETGIETAILEIEGLGHMKGTEKEAAVALIEGQGIVEIQEIRVRLTP